MRNAVIHSTGLYAPKQIIPNSYFDKLLGENVSDWLEENLHIYERHWCNEDESTIDLCFNAAQNALQSADLSPEKLDLIIVATDTPEYISPSTAAVLQHQLNASNAGTFDVNTACAGFVTAIDIASKYIIADKKYNYVLIVGAYAMSKYLNKTDKKTVNLFADGAGAVILKAEENTDRGFLDSELHTEGKYYSWMGIYAGGTNKPLSQQVLKDNDHLLRFVSKFPKDFNIERWSDTIMNMLSRLKLKADDIDHYFFTQININTIYQTLDKLGVSHKKAHTIMEKYAYTGSACIPMAIADAANQGKLKKNDLIILMGSGGGLAYAGAAFRW